MPIQTIKRIDQQIKWWLLLVSVVTLGALIYAAVTENVLAPWRLIRMQYAGILQEKATDERGQTLADQFEIRIVQSYVPTLESVDRCITCHPGIDDPRMSGEKLPFQTHPGELLVSHPPEQFGCTICHRGQGRALVFADAKGDESHWDYPLLPKHLTQSSCGQCHSAEEVSNQGGEKYALGKQLFEQKGCYSCHKLHGRGGNMGPQLDKVGLKIKHILPMAHVEGPHTLPQWLIEHFEDPQKIVADSQMKPPNLSGEEMEALTTYMLSLQERDIPKVYLSAGKLLELYKQIHPDPNTGQELYERYCSTCHDTGEYTRYDKFYQQFFPAVRGISYIQTASRNYLKENIRLGHQGTLMPSWDENAGGLTEEEINKIVDYLQDIKIPGYAILEPKMIQGAQDPSLKITGDISRGAKIFTKHCAACHLSGLAPDLFNLTFQNTATDGFVFTTILQGRKNTPMPEFFAPEHGGFGLEEISDLTAFILNKNPNSAQKVTYNQANQKGE